MEEKMAEGIKDALKERDGDVLAFLPGEKEIMYVWIFLNNVSFKHIHKVTVISSSIKSWSWIFLVCSICSIFTSISILLSTSLSRLSSSTSLDRFVVMLVDIIVTRTS